ncbi:MAG: hypothetical protein ACRCU0_06925 [Candidatus Rhabdochlamydia sp.]
MTQSINNRIQNFFVKSHVNTQDEIDVNLQKMAESLAPLNQQNMMYDSKDQDEYVMIPLNFNFNFGGHSFTGKDKLSLNDKAELKTFTIKELLTYRENKI